MVHIFLLWDVSSIVFCTQRRGSWHDYWGSRVESVVPDFKPKAWWDFLLETPGREMTITGESDFSPGLSSSTTLVQPTYFLWETAVTVIVCFWLWCLAFSSVSGFHLYSSLGLFGVWGFPSVSHVREGTMLMHLDSPQPPRIQTTSSENWSCPKPISNLYWLNPQQGDHI